eukprot:1161230-Pelagomonas_calceolata.AAC.14
MACWLLGRGCMTCCRSCRVVAWDRGVWLNAPRMEGDGGADLGVASGNFNVLSRRAALEG